MSVYEHFNKYRLKFFKNLWYYVLHSTIINTYICNANNNVKKSTFLKKVLYGCNERKKVTS